MNGITTVYFNNEHSPLSWVQKLDGLYYLGGDRFVMGTERSYRILSPHDQGKCKTIGKTILIALSWLTGIGFIVHAAIVMRRCYYYSFSAEKPVQQQPTVSQPKATSPAPLDMSKQYTFPDEHSISAYLNSKFPPTKENQKLVSDIAKAFANRRVTGHAIINQIFQPLWKDLEELRDKCGILFDPSMQPNEQRQTKEQAERIANVLVQCATKIESSDQDSVS